MKTLGNIIWFLFGGIILGFGWILCGFLWCITIIGIPVGVQCFKLATLGFWPFGRSVVYQGGVGSFIVNILWFFFGGIEMALVDCVVGLFFCVTIIGIPFGLQCFKLAKLSLAPFGAVVVHEDY